MGNREDGAIKRIILWCSQGNRYKTVAVDEESATKTIKRIRASRSTGYRLKAVIKGIDEHWQVTVLRGKHNHRALDEASAYPSGRALNEPLLGQLKLLNIKLPHVAYL